MAKTLWSFVHSECYRVNERGNTVIRLLSCVQPLQTDLQQDIIIHINSNFSLMNISEGWGTPSSICRETKSVYIYLS